ncbi:MAG: hypothetical protein ACRD0J_06415 [Acidimicrobiales bacterium]
MTAGGETDGSESAGSESAGSESAGTTPAGLGARAALARAVADAVARVPGVARLSAGGRVEAATQYPGGKIVGVVITGPEVVVHVVLDRLPVDTVAEPARDAASAALRRLGDEREVEVVVEDLELPSPPQSGLAGPPAWGM